MKTIDLTKEKLDLETVYWDGKPRAIIARDPGWQGILYR